MKMFIVKVVFGISFLLIGCSNEEWFDIKSNKSLSVPSTLPDLQALLDNAELFNAWYPEMGENASDYHFFSNSVLNSISGYERNSYTWSKENPHINVTDWTNGSNFGSYARIYCANLILETVEKIDANDNDATVKRSIKGQALFLRAKTFYELAMIFAPPYDKSTSDKNYGLPLRLVSDISLKSKRSSVEETYNQIIKDLSESIDLLPDVQNFVTRPSKLATYALLSRIYLSLENYPEAFKYANLCLEKYSILMDYSGLSYQLASNPFIGYNKEVIFYSYINGINFTPQRINIDNNFYNSYNDNDLRKKAFFNFNPGTQLVVYKGTYSGVGFNYFFNGLATDELYLIRAECYARAENGTNAMRDLNTLLKTRWLGTYTDMTAANAEEALTIILRERKKELVLRGVRWSDLRRLNKDPRFVQTFTRTVAGKTYTLEPNSYKYTFPIPDDILRVTDMEQNPGWK